jgi:hypothetical protein
MHCPICGQQQASEETRFCSRCGFLLTGVARVVASGGVLPTASSGITGAPDSPRRRGVKQGVFLFLLAFLVVPIMALITLALSIPPFLPVLGLLLFGVGGLLRIAYAMLLEPGTGLAAGTMPSSSLRESDVRSALPPSQTVPASAYASPAGRWRDTNELLHEPGSVTDSTTKLLQKDEADQ